MIMLSIFAMTALVFLSRYLFLEPKLPLRLSPTLQRLLSYSGPAVLTAIWAPIVFMPEKNLVARVAQPLSSRRTAFRCAGLVKQKCPADDRRGDGEFLTAQAGSIGLSP